MMENARNTDAGAWQIGGAGIDALAHAVAGVEGFQDIGVEDLVPLDTKGLVHAHVRVRGRDAVLRIPRLNLAGKAPGDNLLYQAACFGRASASGHAPQVFGSIPPMKGIPWGALLVEEVQGKLPYLPDDIGAIARALAAIHGLSVPERGARPPLPSHEDPIGSTLNVIEAQSAYLHRADIDKQSLAILEGELAWARSYAETAAGSDVPIALVGTDTHPGNFMVDGTGRAVFVDLEKTQYGMPAIDLAHATVYTSTMWDPDIATELTDQQVAAFYAEYFDAVPDDLAERVRPGCAPLRRFAWLRTTTWCAKWWVESRAGAAWSATRHDPAYTAAVRRRVADYLNPDTIDRIRTGLESKSWIG